MNARAAKYPKVQIVQHTEFGKQRCKSGRFEWSVLKLIEYSKDLPVFDLPLAYISLDWWIWNERSPRQMAGHIKAAMEADLSKPIILCEDGGIMDGRHRIMRALVEGKPTIKAVRFEQDPPPCEVTGG